jgi:hypothetical protein
MFFAKKDAKVVACRMQEAIIFDESIKNQYEYAYFPGMCPCIGIIIKDTINIGRMAVIHYLGGTNPESVLDFIKNYFPSQCIEITTFAGNAPKRFDIPSSFPTISVTSPNIKEDTLPKLESTDFMSSEDYYNVALQNRFEVNYILKALYESDWSVDHIHNDTVSFGDNVFYNFKTYSLSTNLDVNVIRDDHTMEDKKDLFFDPDRVTKDNLAGRFYMLWNGWSNIAITDKRSWTQYSSDLSDAVTNYYVS